MYAAKVQKMLKIALVALFGVGIWAFSRSFLFRIVFSVDDPPLVTAYGFNSLYINKTFFAIIAIIGVIVLTSFSISFSLVEKYLPGKKFQKGILWGLFFYILYTVAFFEFYTIFGGTIRQALIAGIADGGPLLLTGIFAGILLGSEKSKKMKLKPGNIIGILLAFIGARIIFYKAIYPTHSIFELQSILFISLYGLLLGVGYRLFTGTVDLKREIFRPLLYAAILLPISLSGNTLICFKYNFPLVPMVLLTVLDMTAIVIGTWLSNPIGERAASLRF